MNSYEQLVAEIQHEAKNFQEENRQLRENLAVIIEENNRLRMSRSNNESEDLVGNFRRDYIDMAEKIFRNLRDQFVLCQKVNNQSACLKALPCKMAANKLCHISFHAISTYIISQ